MAYRTNLKYNNRKAYKSRFLERIKKSRSKRGRKSWSKSVLGKSGLKGKIRKIMGVFAGIIFVIIFIGTVFTLSVVAKYSAELPNPEEPFERGQALTSYVYDRNGKELYKIHGDENRDIVSIEEVPLEVQWAFLAAEDVDFYKHKGVDMGGLVKAVLYELFKIGNQRGGSTITQQMIKNTVLSTERTYERKVKEIILSLKIEQRYNKQEVLQLYLNEIGFGGNTYGVKTAARLYFGKDIKDITLGEAALLAGLPQAPGLYSPLFASDIKLARELALNRQNYVLDQMLSKKNLINAYAREYNNWQGEEDLITEEKIQQAREEKIKYESSKINIEAPHFVFYVEDELQKGKYNNGNAFSLTEIERGGLKITTSVDLDIQHLAEESVKSGVEKIAKGYGANNTSLIMLDNKTGQILAMVGSADYFGEPSPEGCIPGENCKFEPQVNVSIALRQPGSSLKPMVYYTGFETGQLYPAYVLPDIPITFSNKYEPKNNEGGFFGVMNLRRALRLSRNIPAVEAIEIVGVTTFLNTLEKLGYTTFTHPENYGAAIALGAGDVKLIEHTNAFAVFGSGGIYHSLSPILKVEDKDGNVLYDYEKDESHKGVRVADERACYLINDAGKNYHFNPPAGYDTAGKTGTSDDNKNVYYMGYTTEFSIGVWSGNNDNSRLSSAAYGFSISRPIWIDFVNKIIGRYPPTTFPRPGGIVSASVCSDSGLLANENCEAVSDLFIQGMLPKEDDTHKVYRVCTDQTDRLAREIDEQLGYATDQVYRYIVAPKPEWQEAWDKAFEQSQPPTEYCDVNRNPTGNENPWVTISKPSSGTKVKKGGSLEIEATAYSSAADVTKIEVYIDDVYITQASSNPYIASITVPQEISDGNHNLIVKAYDDFSRSGFSSVPIIVGDTVSITIPTNGSNVNVDVVIDITAIHSGATKVNSAYLIINNGSDLRVNMEITGADTFVYAWTPEVERHFTFQVMMQLEDGRQISSSRIEVNAVE